MRENSYCSSCEEPYCQCFSTRNPKPEKPTKVREPRKLFMSVAEIFQRIDAISELVAARNHNIPEAARLRIAEELVKLGYELAEARD